MERLRRKGLETITHADLENLHGVKVLLRAHGEPPATYELARRNGIEIIDATCPVVLQLQRRIKASADEGRREAAEKERQPLIVIYGKPGHAEVNGLVGQTDGTAIVVDDTSSLAGIDFSRPIALYSQTTKSLDGFHRISDEFRRRAARPELVECHDTICRQVANRASCIALFASRHESVLFVSGKKSSNGKVLFSQCLAANPRTHLIANDSEIDPEWIAGVGSIGICGATSTPRWLMEQVRERCRQILDCQPD